LKKKRKRKKEKKKRKDARIVFYVKKLFVKIKYVSLYILQALNQKDNQKNKK
jgi:hypothetical protein